MRETTDTPLERLLIDASLGEPDPDWRWLLEQYLAEHPEHRKQAEALRATVGLAKETLAATRPARAALPPRPDFERAGRGRFFPQWLLWPAFATLCVLIGWTFGSLQSQQSPSEPAAVTSQAALRTVAPVQLASGEGERPSGDFWSHRRWAERFQRNPLGQSRLRTIEWEAPFVPKIEGRTERET